MFRTQILILPILLLGLFHEVHGEWYEAQFDGSVLPTEASPAWGRSGNTMPGNQITDGKFKMVIPLESASHSFTLGAPSWDASDKDFTIEFRAWVLDSDQQGVRFNFSNGKQSWIIFLKNGESNDTLSFQNVGSRQNQDVKVDNDYAVVRVCVQHHVVGLDRATVYINGKKTVENWSGYGAKATDNKICIGDGSKATREAGTVMWEYIRWALSHHPLPSAEGADTMLPNSVPVELALPVDEKAEFIPQVKVARVDKAPIIDGRLDDPVWRSASTVELHAWRGNKENASPTQVKLCTDGPFLYIAFICNTPSKQPVVPTRQQRDQYLGGSDTVEVFLDPNLDRSTSYQIALNISNTLLDAYCGSLAWNGHIQSATSVEKHKWTAELSIELSSLDRTSCSAVWGLNVNHVQADTHAMMTWAPLRSTHNEPERFGYAAFADKPLDTSTLISRLSELHRLAGEIRASTNDQVYALYIDFLGQDSQSLNDDIHDNLNSMGVDQFIQHDRAVNVLLDQTRSFQKQLQYIISTTPQQPLVSGAGYAVVPMASLVKVGRTFTPPTDFKNEVEISAARGESESFQLVIVNGSKPMVSGRVRLLPLRNKKAVINVTDMNLWSVEYVRLDKPSKGTDVKPNALVPDPLVQCDTLTISPYDHQTVWVTVHVPRDAISGRYEAHVEVYAPGFEMTRVPVILDVMDFELPIRPALRTSFGLWGKKGIDYAYEMDRNSAEFREMHQRYAEALLQYRITPRDFPGYDPSKPDQYFQWVQKRLAMGATILTCPFQESPPVWFKSFWQKLKAKGLADMLYVRPGDEPTPPRFKKIIDSVESWRDVAPEINMQVAGNEATSNKMNGTINAWCPLTSGYDPYWARQRQQKGEEVWWYVCNVPMEPFANFKIDQQAICHRILFWQTFANNIDGLLYWNVINYRDGDPWRQTPYWSGSSGDGALFYPGNHGPLPSIRLEVMRDGIDDYDYLHILQKLIQKAHTMGANTAEVREAEAAMAINAICGDLRYYTRDVNTLLQRRLLIGRSIVELKKLFIK